MLVIDFLSCCCVVECITRTSCIFTEAGGQDARKWQKRSPQRNRDFEVWTLIADNIFLLHAFILLLWRKMNIINSHFYGTWNCIQWTKCCGAIYALNDLRAKAFALWMWEESLKEFYSGTGLNCHKRTRFLEPVLLEMPLSWFTYLLKEKILRKTFHVQILHLFLPDFRAEGPRA